ncbi:MAG: hypothetical protein N2450_04560 [bacterium]|nr:hypothetical protein [bacterium]
MKIKALYSAGIVFFLSIGITSCFKTLHEDPFSTDARTLYFNRLANSGYDLIIMDYSQNGTEALKFTRSEIDLLRIQSNALVFVKYPLGVAKESYSYWQNVWDLNHDGLPDSTAPRWLIRKRSMASDEWLVRFWDDEWKFLSTLSNQSHLVHILEASYDGCYFTSLDSWNEISEIPNLELTFKNSVIEIIDSLKRRFPWMKFIGENVNSLSRYPDLVNQMDGVIQTEFVWGYNGQDGVYVPEERRNQIANILMPFQLSGKFIGIIDFPFSSSTNRVIFDEVSLNKIYQGYQIALNYRYIYYPAVRELNDLTIVPNYEPIQNVIPIRYLSDVQEFCIQLRPSFYNL